MTPTVLNMESDYSFGNMDMKINYLKDYAEKVTRFRYGPEWRYREKIGRRSQVPGNITELLSSQRVREKR